MYMHVFRRMHISSEPCCQAWSNKHPEQSTEKAGTYLHASLHRHQIRHGGEAATFLSAGPAVNILIYLSSLPSYLSARVQVSELDPIRKSEADIDAGARASRRRPRGSSHYITYGVYYSKYIPNPCPGTGGPIPLQHQDAVFASILCLPFLFLFFVPATRCPITPSSIQSSRLPIPPGPWAPNDASKNALLMYYIQNHHTSVTSLGASKFLASHPCCSRRERGVFHITSPSPSAYTCLHGHHQGKSTHMVGRSGTEKAS